MKRRHYSNYHSSEDFIVRFARRRIRGAIITVISVLLLFIFIFAKPLIIMAAEILHNSIVGSSDDAYPDKETSSYEYKTEEAFGNSDSFSKNLTLDKSLKQYRDKQYKDMGDEIGTISATEKWQTFHVYTEGEYSRESNFVIDSPGTGYIIFKVKNSGDTEPRNYVLIKADGFEYGEYLTPGKFTTYIGVGKGRYNVSTCTISSGYDMMIRFVPVKEDQYGVLPKKAPELKRYQSREGIIRTDKPVAHWYKIRHEDTKPVKVKVKTLSSSGGLGEIQVSLYNGSTCIGSDRPVERSEKFEFTVPSYRNAAHLDEGVYYIKVEGHLCGNGYYSVSWE